MKHIIYVFGASGSGTSTLGKYISSQQGYKWMDSDDYYWMPTNPPYTTPREQSERVRLMKEDIKNADNVVISGSISKWGDEIIPDITLAVRLVTATSERVKRIRAREYKKFGDRIMPGGDMYQQHEEFIQWAMQYDNGGCEGRSKTSHDEWQKKLQCKVIVIDGTDSLENMLKKIKIEGDI